MKHFIISLHLLIVSCSTFAQLQLSNAALNGSLKKVQLLQSVQLGTNKPFDKQFNENATGRNDKNTYLLCYLTTLIYPQYLKMIPSKVPTNYEVDLHRNKNNFFEKEYKRFTQHLFTNPEYAFVTRGNKQGYDPEAMVVNTLNTIYVVFRGTDRTAKNKVESLDYEIAEWIKTDFDILQTTDISMEGKFHQGFWKSISFDGFKEALYSKIETFGGKTKKIWITGHSLGCAQAQLFAMYMAKRGIKASGLHLFAAPNPGNVDFAKEMDRLFPGNRLQRFDFVDDPIPAMTINAAGFAKAGTRVYYNDVKTIQFNAPDRSDAEALKIVGEGVAGAINMAVNGVIKYDPIKLFSGTKMCYHHPLWYLQAAYKQLKGDEKDLMPRPLALPSKDSEGCDMLIVARGNSASITNQIGEVVNGIKEEIVEGIEKLKFATSTIINNATGAAIAEGNYFISSYASGGKLYMNDEDGAENGSDITLTTKKQKVKVEKMGVTGYTIRFQRKIVNGWFGTQDEQEYVLDSDAWDLLDDGATTIQLWEKNNIPAVSLNQRWLFTKVRDNKYVITCAANMKVLDANNKNINKDKCGVKAYAPIADDQTQIWILEKAD
jgi:Lipase (class 3)